MGKNEKNQITYKIDQGNNLKTMVDKRITPILFYPYYPNVWTIDPGVHVPSVY